MKAEDAYLSSIHFCNFSLFSGTAGIGRAVGGGGGAVLGGQEHGLWAAVCWGLTDPDEDRLPGSWKVPTLGKLSSIIPRSSQACSERNSVCTRLEM